MLVPGSTGRAHCPGRSCVLEIEESGEPGKGLSMAQSEKRENSVLFSLRELRQIEENRVQEEEQAVRSADAARRQAAEDAERRRRDAEEAKIREERDAALAIETARENAEREARMRVESAEA